MNELNRFDYGDLEPGIAEFARERAQRIHRLARLTAATIGEIGHNLTEVKERVGHGKFLAWVEAEFAWKERTAQYFMNVHKHLKSANLADLQIDASALYLIAAPKTSDSARADLIRLAESGEHVTHAIARAVIEGPRAKKAHDELGAIITGRLEDIAIFGKELMEIRDRRLYVESGYQTFEDYCYGRLGNGLRAEALELAVEFALEMASKSEEELALLIRR